MVFYRAKTSGSEAVAGTGTLAFTIPDCVKPGDYCVLWVATTDTTATVGKPAWLSQIDSVTVGSTNNFILYGGFVPDPISSGNGNITCDHTTLRGWAYSASFWGGVNASTPIAFNDVQAAGGAASTATFQLLQDGYKDTFTSSGNLNGKSTEAGSTSWATSGAGTDFSVTTLSTLGYASSNTDLMAWKYDSPIRYAIAGSSSAAQKGYLSGIIDNSAQYPAVFAEILLRWTDSSNHVKAILRIDTRRLNYLYSQISLTLSINVVVGGSVVQVGTKSMGNFTVAPGWQNFALSAFAYSNGEIEVSTQMSGIQNSSLRIDAAAYCATGQTLASGKLGFADQSDSGSTQAGRLYTKFQSWTGDLSPNSRVLVAASTIGNADTQTISATPRNGVQIDQQISPETPASIAVGRSVYTKYFQDDNIGQYELTAADNLEAGAQNVDQLACGWVALNDAATTNTISLRSTESIESGWKFYLANSSDMSHIGLLNARDRSISWALNRPGECNFTISLSDDIAQQVELVSTCIVAYRDGDIKWSGPVWSIDESAANNTMSISAVGWLQLLEKRLNSPFNEKYLRFDLMDASTIAAHVIALTNMADPLPFSVGGIEATFSTRRSYQKYTSVSSALQDLSDIENGFDFWLDPSTRQLVFYHKLEEDLSSTIAFGYNAGFLNNLAEVSRQRSADKLVNGIYAVTSTSGTTPPEQLNQDSIDQYGLLEEQASLSEANDAKIALAYAAGEFVYRSNPLPIYSITPRSVGGPRVLQDYHIGSIMKFSANKGAIQVSNQKFKVFAISLSIDDNGNETVSQLSITAS